MLGGGEMGIYESLAVGKKRSIDFNDLGVDDFWVENHYGVGERSADEIRQDVESSCMLCFKKFGLMDNRIIATATMQNRDYFVRKGIVSSRYICLDCFNKENDRRSHGRPRRSRFRFRRIASRAARLIDA